MSKTNITNMTPSEILEQTKLDLLKSGEYDEVDFFLDLLGGEPEWDDNFFTDSEEDMYERNVFGAGN